jgi:hypothetical protein
MTTIRETYARSRVSDAAARLRNRAIRDMTVRPDGLVLRILFDGGEMLRVSAEADANGKPRLDVDVLHAGVR